MKKMYDSTYDYDDEVIQSNFFNENGKPKWSEDFNSKLEGYSVFENKYVRINPIVLYKSNIINEFFIGMICAINFNIDPNINGFTIGDVDEWGNSLRPEKFILRVLKYGHNPYFIFSK